MPEREKDIDIIGLLYACLRHIKIILAATIAAGLALGLLQYVRLVKKDDTGNSAFDSYAERLSSYRKEIAGYDSQLANVEDKIQDKFQPWNSTFFDSWDAVYQTTRIYTVVPLSSSSSQDGAASFAKLWKDSDLFGEMDMGRSAYYTALLTDASGNVIQNKWETFVSLYDSDNGTLVLSTLGESPERAEELADIAETLLLAKWNDPSSGFLPNALTKTETSSQKVYEKSNLEQVDLYNSLVKRRDEIIAGKGKVSAPANPWRSIVKWASLGALLGFVIGFGWVFVLFCRRQTLEYGYSAEKTCGIPLLGNKQPETAYLTEQLRVLSDEHGKIVILSDVTIGENELGRLCSEKVFAFDDFFRNKDALNALKTADAVILWGKTGVSSAIGFEKIRSFAGTLNKPTIGYIME